MAKPNRRYEAGQVVIVRLGNGQIVEAKIRAVLHSTDGTELQVDFGYHQTAKVNERDVKDE
jgi:hypothetical protein